jgi:hypothetical protein
MLQLLIESDLQNSFSSSEVKSFDLPINSIGCLSLKVAVKITSVESKSMVEKEVMICRDFDWSMMEKLLHCFYLAGRKTNWGRLKEYFLQLD